MCLFYFAGMSLPPVLWAALFSGILYLFTNHGFCSRFLCRLASPKARGAAVGCTYSTFSAADKKHCDTLLPSMLHAVVSVTLASMHCADCLVKMYLEKNSEDVHLSRYTSCFSEAALGFSFAYFVVDAAVVYHRRISGAVVVIHHLMTAAGMAAGILTGFGHLLICLLILNEVTTPFVDMRWLLDKTGNKGSSLYFVNGVLLTLTWFFARIMVFVPCFVFASWAWKDTEAALSVGVRSLLFTVPSFLFVLNLHWFGRILKGLRKHIYTNSSKQ